MFSNRTPTRIMESAATQEAFDLLRAKVLELRRDAQECEDFPESTSDSHQSWVLRTASSLLEDMLKTAQAEREHKLAEIARRVR